MNYQINYEVNPKAEDLQILNNGIMQYAIEKKGMRTLDFFAFFIRDENKKIIGGCGGCNMHSCLYIDQLWIIETLRGNGYGRQLMNKAEALAIENQCNFIAVNTFDWEALNFYKKLGFYVEFERNGFDKNSIFYFLRKDLVREFRLKVKILIYKLMRFKKLDVKKYIKISLVDPYQTALPSINF